MRPPASSTRKVVAPIVADHVPALWAHSTDAGAELVSPLELVSAAALLDVEAPEEPLPPVVLVEDEDVPLAPVVVETGAVVPDVVAFDVVVRLVVDVVVFVLLEAPLLDVSLELPAGDTGVPLPVSSLHDVAHKLTVIAVKTVEALTTLGKARKRMGST